MNTDAEFARQVEADAIATGWPADVAKVLARLAGKPTARPPRPTARGPVGKAPKGLDAEREIVALVRLVGLPACVVAEFRAAGITSAERAREMLKPLIDPRATRNAGNALRLQLFAMARARGTGTA